MKNYMNYDMLKFYSMFAVTLGAGMDKFGGIFSSSWWYYIILITLAYLVVGIIWWFIKYWKVETRWHKIVMALWLALDIATIVMDIIDK